MNMTFNRAYSWLRNIFRLTVHQVVTDISVIRITLSLPSVCNMAEKNVTKGFVVVTDFSVIRITLPLPSVCNMAENNVTERDE